MQTKSPDNLTYAAFVAVVIFGGLNAIGIRFIVAELPPFWGATLRFAPASALLFLLVLIQRLQLPSGRALLGAVIYGVLEFGIAFIVAWVFGREFSDRTAIDLLVLPTSRSVIVGAQFVLIALILLQSPS